MLGVIVSGVNLNIVLERETIWMRVFVVVLSFRGGSSAVHYYFATTVMLLQNTVVVHKLCNLVC